MSARFVVRVGRRWRELDLVSGRVSGLGDVSLVRVRRGRLEVVPRAPALRALRTLLSAGSKRSAAKDGPRLSQIRYPVNPRRSKGRQGQQIDGHKGPPVHTCCQQHHYQCNTDANFNSILRPPTSTVGVQCSGQAPAATTLNTHTNRVTDQTEEIHTCNQSQRVKDHGSESLQNKNHDSEEPRTKSEERIKRRTLLGRKRQTQESVSSINSVAAQRTENSRHELVEGKVSKNVNQESSSSDSEFESGIGNNKLERTKRPGSREVRRRHHGTEGRKAVTERYEQTQEGACKELLISEETVLLLRGFLERDARDVFGVQLERYDADDAYKARVFYRLNPIVALERCPQISRMLRERASQADSVSLKDFFTNLGLRSVAESSVVPSRCPQISRMLRERASQADSVSLKDFFTNLGLRSVAESSAVQSRYRMRRRSAAAARPPPPRPPRPPRPPPPRAPQRDRGLEETERSRKDQLMAVHPAEPAANHTRPDTRNSSRKELEEVASSGGLGEQRRPGKPTTGKLVGARQYSREEDEFIVRWVRGENRARLVNGNRLWVQLQPQHRAGTGCFRSWHSLRNRYLRYLLPALGTLPLPPAEAARLRAAAATGSLKARKQPARRNSAFQQPRVRSAWALRPAPPPPQTIPISDTEETQKRALRSKNTLTHTAERTPTAHADATRTPTYSELTERFARRHRSTPDTDTDSDSDATDTTDTRVRHTRHSNRIRYSSESDSGQTPIRKRSTRLSVVNGDINGRHDDTDARDGGKKHRHSDKTGRNHKTKRRSKSLDSDTDSLLKKRRRSGRLDTNKSGRLLNNSGQVADNRESNKRKRNASRDSDTDSRSNKRRRSTRLDTSAHTDSGRQNGQAEQVPDKRRSKSLDSDTDTSLYSSSSREKSVDKSGRQSAEESKRRNESGQKSNKSGPRRNKSGRFIRTSDRQKENVRDGDKNDSTHKFRQRLNADKIMSKNYQNSEKSDRNGRHKDGHSENGRLADNTDRRKPRARRLYNPNAI